MAKYVIEVIGRKTDEAVGVFVKDKNIDSERPRLDAVLDISEELIGKRNIFVFATLFKYTVKEI